MIQQLLLATDAQGLGNHKDLAPGEIEWARKRKKDQQIDDGQKEKKKTNIEKFRIYEKI